IFISGIDLNGGGSESVTVGEDGRINLVNVGDSRLDYKRVFDSHGLVSYTAVKWWNQRKLGGVVSQLKGDWVHRSTSGIVHSIDINPSRKHVCLAVGSSGIVFAWDLTTSNPPFSQNVSNTSSKRVLPVMMCSEDGILASSEQGGNQVEVLAETCPINSFYINQILGIRLKWWDQRKLGGVVSQLKGDWAHGSTYGIAHSINIHPSRKHVCC
ncbi:hypothetical protein MKW98_013967, partial [Papaver atlanticum]